MTNRRWWYFAAFSFICMSGLVGCACYGSYGGGQCGPGGCPAPGQYGAAGPMGPIPGSGTMAPGGTPMQPAPGSGFMGSGGF
ncbi:MAG: hypothetical protein HQ518_15920 [Rhodopirellula sp.]|nr:hypothetical protein [Rhodopirellula sp.]